MPLRNSQQSYGSVAKTFHWLMFLLIVGLFCIGFLMTGMENTPDKFKLIGLHKATGIVVLLLATIRLLWKAVNVSPLLPAHMNIWEKSAAHMGHAALYFLMFAMPLSGWAMSSAAGFPVSVFGVFTLPDLLSPDKELKEFLLSTHEILAWILIVVVGLHILAALLHHFYYRNNVLRRMLPFQRRSDVQESDTISGC